MAKSSNQKLKLLYILKLLNEKTDETHVLSPAALIKELDTYGIHAERKSIYDDIDCLIRFGYDILYVKAGTGSGYYLADREFELPELKLLVDAVQSSRFITQKKSRELIAKIEKLAGPYEAKKLQRQVIVAGRIKAENESIYYNVDCIHKAIQEDMPITFTYLEWNISKKLQPRKEGFLYQISPWALTWKDDNYYLVAYDEKEEKIKHFRVDKMSCITGMEGKKRAGLAEFGKLDIAEYTNQTFGMFGGNRETVSLLLPSSMIGIMIDRFGKEIIVIPREDDWVSVRIKVAVSGQFYGWLAGLGSKVAITSPEWVKKAYTAYLKEIINEITGSGQNEEL